MNRSQSMQNTDKHPGQHSARCLFVATSPSVDLLLEDALLASAKVSGIRVISGIRVKHPAHRGSVRAGSL